MQFSDLNIGDSFLYLDKMVAPNGNEYAETKRFTKCVPVKGKIYDDRIHEEVDVLFNAYNMCVLGKQKVKSYAQFADDYTIETLL